MQVVAWIRRILRVDKTGHSGTLDPKVSPLLPETDGTAVGVIVAGVPATGDGADDPVVGEEVPPLEL